MATFEPGSWVWIPDEEEMYLPGKVTSGFRAGDAGAVTLEDGRDVALTAEESAKCVAADEEALVPVDNMVSLNDLNEPVILHNLRIRYKKDAIYTNVSSILIAVNPFRLLPIYTPEVLDKYRETNGRGMAPHIFAVADAAYSNMLADLRDQAVVISGESGAGKTETMKLVLQYLAEASGRAAKQKEADGESLEQQILKSNPVMEGFGNAKTSRNNNSSRFGKWTEVKFSRGGEIVGGSIINYLLEKSRIPFQAEGERNYHAFYQLLAGADADPALKAALELKDPEDYHYLNQSGVTTVEGINDEKDFEEMTTAMDVLGMDEARREQIFRLLSAILNLGNLEYAEDGDDEGSKISNDDVLALAATQLKVDTEALRKCLLFRGIGTRSITYVNYKLAQVADVRDALSKALYGKLFDWLIQAINVSLSAKLEASGVTNLVVIGILDIFGFESFETNSFEQLCINYCNEKLQFHFNEHIFRMEQEEYKREGINVDAIQFKDNQPCLDLLEAKATGIFSMIDEEINVPRGSDEGFLGKALQKHAKHENFARPKPKDLNSRIVFIVKHYAGAVPYNVTSFLEKNKDALHEDISATLQTSEDTLIRELMTPKAAPEPAGGRRGKRKQLTLGAQFKQQLAALMTRLNSTDPHFVRCMKPNHVKKGQIFEAPMMLAQLRYAGLLEVCRIRQIGYPVRKEFDEFLFRYRCLALGSASDHATLGMALQEKGLMPEGEWQIGHSKVFMRNKVQGDLEFAREGALAGVVAEIQKVVRGFVCRCRYKRYREILGEITAAIAARTEDALEEALRGAVELPFGGDHLGPVKEARALKERLDEEKRVAAMCSEAIAERDLSSLQAAVGEADAMSFSNPVVEEARALIARIEEEKACLAELSAAVSSRDKAAIDAAMGNAVRLELTEHDTYKQAAALKKRLEEEEAAHAALAAAIAAADYDQLDAALGAAAALGLEGADVDEATALRTKLAAQANAKRAIRTAMEDRDADALGRALAKAGEVGLPASDATVAEGAAMKEQLAKEAAAVEALTAATGAKDAKALEKAVAGAESIGLPDCSALTQARTTLKRLNDEAAAIAALKAATKSKDAGQLATAIATAAELGIEGKEMDAAQKAMSKLGAQSAGLAELAAAVASGDLEKVNAAIAKAEEAGIAESDQYKSALKAREKLERQGGVLESLRAAMTAKDVPAIEAALAEAEEVGLERNYPEEVAAGRALIESLGAGVKAQKAIREAISQMDEEGLTAAVTKAEAAGVDESILAEGREGATKIAAMKEKLPALESALEAKDKESVTTLYGELKDLGLDANHDTMKRARVIAERDILLKEIRDKAAKARETSDLQLANEALEKAIEIGLDEEELKELEALKKELEAGQELAAGLSAACKTIKNKATGKAGLTAADLEHLDAAIEDAVSKGLAKDSSAFKKARKTRDKMEKVLQLQDELTAALSDDNIRKVKKLLDRADDLDMTKTSLASKVRKHLRALERAKYESAMGDEDYDEDIPTLDDEALMREREEKMQKAMDPKYEWTNFPRLRNPDDYAKAAMFGRKKARLMMLKWQTSVIVKSLTELPSKELNKEATRMHKSLLGYSGDKSMSFPATLAQDILQKGLQYPELVDEIYCQICKHLTANQRPESAQRGWQVMCMAVGTFPPSREFENYLLNFILAHKDGAGAVGNYARYSLRRLEGILNSGPSGFVPSVEEIQAYKDRPPILATIELVDGTPLTEDLPITPDLNVGKVLDICTHFMELTDPRMQYFGVFVEDVTDPDTVTNPLSAGAGVESLPKTPRPLQNENFLGDVVTVKVRQNQPYKFVFKRKIYLKNLDGPSDDPMFERLVYLQACDEVILGNIPVSTEEEVTDMVAKAMAIDLGEDLPEDPEELIETDLMEYVPMPWRSVQSPDDWADKVLTLRDDVLSVDPEELQMVFVESVKDHPLYGTNFFHVRKHTFPEHMAPFPERLIIAFNSEGLHFLNEDRDTLASFGYADIYRWGGSSTQFSIIIWNAETQDTDDVSMFTSQAADMAALILDYINAIMATTE